MSVSQDLLLLRAHGRCIAALIFALFGACWLLLFCIYSHHFHVPAVIAICLTAGSLASIGLLTLRRFPKQLLSGTLALQKKREDRTFGIINAVTWICVFLLFAILPRFGLQNYVFPGFVAIVGLHFFPFPSLYRHTSNFVIGSFMVLWAFFCAVAFQADGNKMAAYVGLGAGLALWIGCINALLTARRLSKEIGIQTAGVGDTRS